MTKRTLLQGLLEGNTPLTDMMGRNEYIAWCKERSKDMLERNGQVAAWASFISDMAQRRKTRLTQAAIELGTELVVAKKFDATAIDEF